MSRAFPVVFVAVVFKRGQQEGLSETSFHIKDIWFVMWSVVSDSVSFHQLCNSLHASLSVLQESQSDSESANVIRPKHKP